MGCGCKKNGNNAVRAPSAPAGSLIVFFSGSRPGGIVYFAPGTNRYLLGANPSSYFAAIKEVDWLAIKAKYGKELLLGHAAVATALIPETTENQEWLTGWQTLLSFGYKTLGEVAAAELSELQLILGDQALIAFNTVRERLNLPIVEVA